MRRPNRRIVRELFELHALDPSQESMELDNVLDMESLTGERAATVFIRWLGSTIVARFAPVSVL